MLCEISSLTKNIFFFKFTIKFFSFWILYAMLKIYFHVLVLPEVTLYSCVRCTVVIWPNVYWFSNGSTLTCFVISTDFKFSLVLLNKSNIDLRLKNISIFFVIEFLWKHWYFKTTITIIFLYYFNRPKNQIIPALTGISVNT